MAKKVAAKNVGLGACATKTSANYCYELKGSVGTAGLPADVESVFGVRAGPLEVQPVEIIDVAQVIQELRVRYPHLKIAMKIDCEGSEYELIQRLATSGELAGIQFLIIEWHRKGPNDLLQFLLAAGFRCISLQPFNAFVGMLYAFASSHE